MPLLFQFVPVEFRGDAIARQEVAERYGLLTEWGVAVVGARALYPVFWAEGTRPYVDREGRSPYPLNVERQLTWEEVVAVLHRHGIEARDIDAARARARSHTHG